MAVRFSKIILGAGATGLFWGTVAAAQDLTTTRLNILGRPGIIEVPTAEVAPDGQLALSYTQFGPVKQAALTFQLTPRLSGSFRYSGTSDLVTQGDTYWDRSFDFSYRLLNESTYRPAVSVGVQGILGTGFLSSEYIVATKSLNDRLRVTGGIGWGRLASDSPWDVSFGTRDSFNAAVTTDLNIDQWFQGPIAPFGGLTYALNDKITLLAEYSADGYVEEVNAGVFEHKSPFNFGVDYKLSENTSLSGFLLHGNEVGLSFSTGLNPKSAALMSGTESAPLPVLVRPTRAQEPEGWSGAWVSEVGDGAHIQSAISKALAKEGMTLEAMSLEALSVEIRYTNARYGARAQALGRLARILTRALPPSVETFILTETFDGVPANSTVLARSDLETKEFSPAKEMLAAARFVDPITTQDRQFNASTDVFPRKFWSVAPYLTTSTADSNNPTRLDFGLRGEIKYEVSPGLSLDAAARLRLAKTASDSVTMGASTIEPVRTSSILYDNAVSLERLTANWYSHPVENVFGRVTVGYLEEMYGGISGEILWKKPNSRLALGAEVNYAVQRDYDDIFDFLEYDIVTGHASAYYAFNNGYHGQLDIGRYLAGDWGATISVDREFNNGWTVGAYATLTDVPFEDFGTGSFDKGVRVTIPTDWFSGAPSVEATDFVVQSFTGDGGARLNVEGRLYDRVRVLQGSEVEGRWGRFWR